MFQSMSIDSNKYCIFDLCHFRIQPTNVNIDAIMHVNHMLETHAMLIVFNPLDETLYDVSLDLDFYYSGAKDTIYMSHEEENQYRALKLRESYHYTLTFDINAKSISYWTFKSKHPEMSSSKNVLAGIVSMPYLWFLVILAMVSIFMILVMWLISRRKKNISREGYTAITDG